MFISLMNGFLAWVKLVTRLIIRESSNEKFKIKDFCILTLDHKLKIVNVERYKINRFSLFVIDFEIVDEDTISECL